jgi:hypothetical protein
MYINLLIPLCLPISVIALAFTALYSTWLIFNDFPTIWGIVIILFSIAYMNSGYKTMELISAEMKNMQTNQIATTSLPYILAAITAVYFITSQLPYEISAWWAIVTPFILSIFMIFQFLFAYCLELISPTIRK